MKARIIPIFKRPSFVYGTKIVEIAFRIGKRITKIKGYRNHYVPIVKHCEVKLGEIEDKDSGRCEIFKKKSSNKFTTMKMPFINGVDFIDFMIKVIINFLIGIYGIKSITLMCHLTNRR